MRSDKAYSIIAFKVEKDLQIHISSVTDPLVVCHTAAFFLPTRGALGDDTKNGCVADLTRSRRGINLLKVANGLTHSNKTVVSVFRALRLATQPPDIARFDWLP